ncbi:Nonribosomal peptide synthetase GRA1 [Exophiala dermatitidis]
MAPAMFLNPAELVLEGDILEATTNLPRVPAGNAVEAEVIEQLAAVTAARDASKLGVEIEIASASSISSPLTSDVVAGTESPEDGLSLSDDTPCPKDVDGVSAEIGAERFWREFLHEPPPDGFPSGSTHVSAANRELGVARQVLLQSSGEGPRLQDIQTIACAAWALLLARYTALASEVILGFGSNASLPLEQQIQHTLPIRISVPSKISVSDYLQNVEQRQVSVLQNGSIGEQAISRLSGDALAACEYRTSILFSPFADNLPNDHNVWKSRALVFTVTDVTENACRVSTRFDEGSLSLPQVDRIVAQLGHVMRTLSSKSNQDLQLSQLELCSPEDRTQIAAWNPVVPSVHNALLHDMVRQTSDRLGDQLAIDAWDGVMSSKQLQSASDKLAHYLGTRGIGAGSRIPLAFSRSLLVPIVQLAVLKAGAAYIGIDPSHPVTRLQKIFDAAEASTIISSPVWTSKFTPCVANVLEISHSFLDSLPEVGPPALPSVSPEDTAVIIFTSGSTGTPKGIIMRHRDFASAIVAHSASMQIPERSRVLQFSSYTFDHSMYEILTTLIGAGIVCIPSEEQRMNNLTGVMQEMKINFIYATPTVAQLLKPADLPDLETLYIGGEAIPQSLLDEWLPLKRVIAGYGPTEAGMCGYGQFAPGDAPNTLHTAQGGLMWVVDPNNYNQLAPVGTVGELLAEGPMVASGYLNDPKKTAEAFVSTPAWRSLFPAASDPAARKYYLTGDYAQHNLDGTYKFLGRIDTQVKVRGQRIELGDIDHQLKTCLPPNTAFCADVVNLADGGNTPNIAAFISLATSSSVSSHGDALATSASEVERFEALVSGLENRLAENLPPYMIPNILIPLSTELPLTASGKLDRKRLRGFASRLTTRDLNATRRHVTARPITTPTEQKLRDLWTTVLKLDDVETIDASSNFFRLGGDSISAMRLAVLGRQANVSLNVSDILSHPILFDMARACRAMEDVETDEFEPFALLGSEAESARNVAAVKCGVDAANIQDIIPCTPLQEGLFALSIRHQGTYVLQKAYPLLDTIDIDRFTKAWNEVALHTASCLRTRIFESAQLQMLQVIVQEDLEWRHVDIGLDEYLQQDFEESMGLNDRLARFAIVQDPEKGSIFVLTIHHAIHDAWSLDLLLDEVARVYAGSRPQPGVSFSGFLHHISLGHDFIKSEWSRELDSSPITDFPSVPIGHVTNPKGFLTLNFELPRSQCSVSSLSYPDAIKARAAWALVLSSYAGSEDVVFASVSNGRGAPVSGVDKLIAPTLATVPARVKIAKEKDLKALFDDIQMQTARLIRIEQYGMQNIQRLGEGARAACAVQNLFMVEIERENGERGDLPFEELQAQNGTAFHTFAFGIRCGIAGSAFTLSANWDEDLLSAEFVQRLLHQLQYVMARVFTEDIATPVKQIRSLSPEDIATIARWNSSPPRREERCLTQLFHETALKYPQLTAVTAWDGQVNYEQLDQFSTRLAAYILNLGDVFAPGDIVVLCFEKSVWTIVSLLAVMKAGGATLLLDPTIPEHRAASILQQASPRLVLTSPQQCDRFDADEAFNLEVIDIGLIATLEDASYQNLPVTAPSQTAFLTFTSGSTGEPKGVVISHRAACSSILAMCEVLDMNENSRLIQFASFAFDAFYGELFAALLTGARLCVITDDDRSNRLSQFIQDEQVNCAFLTPTVGAQLNPDDLPSIKLMAMGGERMTLDCVRVWASRINLVNVYGPSETTIMCSANPRFTCTQSLGNVGRAVGSRLWITDKEDPDSLTPVGVIGEVVAEGPTLATGYLNKPTLTAEVFILNPKWSVSGPLSELFDGLERRFYRTGDLARYNPDGSFEIMGRADTQLKIRGQRVETGDVETQLRKHLPQLELAVEGIKASATDNDILLVAFIARPLAENDPAPVPAIANTDEDKAWLMSQIEGLENQLSMSLPSYMIPSVFLPVTQLPYTGTSKTDRKRLRQMAAELSIEDLLAFHRKEANRRAPNTRAEQQLRDLWAAVLNTPVQDISADDSFFRVGGDSIVAMKLVAAAGVAGFRLKVQDIFQNPVLADMAKVVEAGIYAEDSKLLPFELVPAVNLSVEAAIEQAASTCEVDRADIEDIYPATPLQNALMALSAKNPGTYLGQMTMTLANGIERDRWCKAWDLVCRRSPILRTRFFYTNSGRLMQAVLKYSPKWQTSSNLQDYLQRDKTNPVTVGSPLCRYALIVDEIGDQPTYFVLTLHRSAYDAWSLLRLFEDVEKVYLGEELGTDAVVGFNSFSSLFLRMDEASCVSFWKEQMTDAPIMSYPRLPSLSYQPAASAHHRTTIRTGRNVSDYTDATIIRAAWALLLARYSDDTNDVVFGASLNGRSADIPGITSIIGPTTAVVPVRIKMDKDNQTVDDLLAAIQRQATEMMDFEQYGVYNVSRLSPQIKQACDFQSLLMIQPESESSTAATAGALGLQLVDEDVGPFHTFAISVEAVVGKENIGLTVEYDPKVFQPIEVQRLSAQLEQLLLHLHEPQVLQSKIANLNFISPLDAAQLKEWNPQPPPLQTTCVHALFEESVKQHPNNPAVRSWEGELSYREVDSLAAALAAQLRQRGVRPGLLVPLVFEKSIYTIVTMIAVLKAGGACVALDPAHPLERLRGLVADVQGDLVVSSGKWADKASSLSDNLLVVDDQLITTLRAGQAADTSRSLGANPTALDTAFILFTSGSTGKPKAINITHSSFSSSIRGHAEVLRYGGPGSNNLQFTAYTSDVSIGEIFTSLAVGACVCVPSDSERMNGLSAAMERMGVNWAFLTPSVASLLNPAEVPTLKTLLFGGETATPHNVSTWAPQVYLINSFGPAECSIWTHCEPGIDAHASGHNIGFGIGCNTWIVDPNDHNKLAPIGTIGELIVEGPNVADGYLNNPEKTAAAFISAPSWLPKDRPTGKLYKMGDLVRYLPDGKVHYAGRRDTQVKLRGQRIEMGEIEHQLRLSMPNVTEVAVEMVRPSEGTAPPMLVAFLGVLPTEQCGKATSDTLPEIVTSDHDRQLYNYAMEGIHEKLENVLPRHMIPSAYLPLRLMPFTASAKTDRGKLQKLARSMSVEELSKYSSASSQLVSAPTTDMERTLQTIWAQLLNIDPATFGRENDFFRLGGDSITAMRLVAMLRQNKLDLSVDTVFKNPVLADMALAAKPLQRDSDEVLRFELVDDVSSLRKEAAKACKVDEDQIEDLYPATALQEGLLALSQKEQSSYMAQFAFQIPDHIDMNRLRAAWEMTYQQVPILRTRLFPSQSQGMMQAVVKAKLLWREDRDKAKYLADDRALGMTTGQPLSRFAIVEGRVLVFSAHHAVYDGWSVQPIYRRVEEIYHGLATKQPVYFNQFIKYLQSIDRNEVEEFWRKQLQGSPPAVFPPQTPGAEFKEAVLSMQVNFNKREGTGVTGATLVRTALALVLGQYSDLDDVVYGCTQSGRAAPLPEIAEIAGPTLATTPVRVSFAQDMKIAQLLQQVQQQSFDIIPYEHTGLQNIQKVSEDAKIACSFKALLVIQNPEDDFNKSHATFLGCPTANKDFFKPFHTYPFVLQCTFNPQGYLLDLNHDSAALPPAQAQRLLEHFVHLVEQLDVPDEDRLVRDLDLTVPGDLSDIARFNGDMVEPVDKCLHELFQSVAVTQPNAPAITAWDGDLTYGQLDELSSKLAHELIAQGVTTGSIVPICMEKSIWAVVSMIAILKAGAAYCPLDSRHPAERLRECILDTEASMVLGSPATIGLFADFACTTVSVSSSFVHSLPTRESGLDSVNVTPAHTAYCFFTSGSSGKPKGVLTSHRAISTSISQHGAFGFQTSSRALQFSAYTFDISIVEIFSTLANGGCICTPSESQRLDALVEAMNEMAVTIAILTPSFAKAVKPTDVPHLKMLVLGAEPIRKDLIEEWAGKVHLLNAYGVTEAAVCNMITEVDSPDFSPHTIGKALGSVSWIVNPNNHNRLVPVGITGELAIEGPILASGYLKDPAKTAAAFIENPTFMDSFQRQKPSRIYLTGDLVKCKPTGLIDFIGRKDTQIKLRGLRIELGEIEYQVRVALGPQPDIAAEVVTPGGRLDQPTIALFLRYPPTDKEAPSTNDGILVSEVSTKLQNHIATLYDDLQKTLPSYMIPTICFFLATMPMLSSGKIDRKILKKLAIDHDFHLSIKDSSVGQKLVPPTTEAEFRLQALWGSTLSVEADLIGKNSSFFRLGGDSLTAVKLVSAARAENIGLTVAKIFDNPTLEEMASAATKTAFGAVVRSPPAFSLVKSEDISVLLQEVAQQANLAIHEIEDVYPTTPLQEGMMVASLQDVGTYNAHFVYRLAASVDMAKFRLAWLDVISRCQTMRTRIVHTDSAGFLQVVAKAPLEIKRIPGTDVEAYKRRVEVMGLGKALYAMAILGEEQEGEDAVRYLVLTMHHAGYDGWSVTNIWRAVQEAYFDMPQSPILGVNHLIRYLGEQTEEANLEFWRNYLDGSKPPAFPPLPQVGYRSVADSELTTNIKFVKTANSDTTTATLLQAAWGLLMSLHEGSQDVTFGVVVSGRTTPVAGIENMIGSAIANFPFRVQHDPAATVSEFLNSIKTNSTDIIPYMQFGFQNIRKASPDAKAASALRTLLVFQAGGASSLDMTIERMGITPQPVKVAGLYTYPITASCTLEDDEISVNVSYDSELLSHDLIIRLMQQFEYIIGQLATSPNTKLQDLQLVGPADMSQIQTWHAQDKVCPNETTIHQMFRKQAAATPNAPAVDSWDGKLTYGELDELSDRLGQVLMERGVGPEVFVAFCFDKSIWAVVSILAIWKAGGVWAPLNSAHPKSRLHSLIQRLSAPLVLVAPHLKPLFEDSAAEAVVVSPEMVRSLPAASPRLKQVPVESTGAAYIMFTSGSTGEPKGVVVEHRNAASGLPAQAAVQGKNSTSRYLQFAAFTWDFCVGEMFANLLHGACICMPSEHDRLNNLAGAIKAMGINQASLTPTVAKLLHPSDTPLKTLSLGGEALTRELVNMWAEHTDLINVYGPTECTVWCAGRNHLKPGDSPANIGWGLNCSMWIADPINYNRLMPLGTVGEILVDGPVVARGYLNDPTTTAKVFLDRPQWAQGPGSGKIYATGDLGVYEPDGSIRVLGRRDMQVKLNGQRVDLGEIDYQLVKVLPIGSKVATELVRPQGRERPLLVVFVAILDANAATLSTRLLHSLEARERLEGLVAGIQKELSAVLPEFMVPQFYLPVNKIPASSNLKIDHKDLQSLCVRLTMEELSRLAVNPGRGEVHEPTTESALRLRDLWAEILGVNASHISAGDTFSGFGGDSMAAVRLVSLARSKGLSLTVADILQHQQLDEMSTHMSDLNASERAEIPPYALMEGEDVEAIKLALAQKCGLDVDTIEDLYPATPAQIGFLKVSAQRPGVTSLLTAFQIPDHVDIEKLKAAWDYVVESHAILRTRVVQYTDGRWFQIVEKEETSPWREAKSLREYHAMEDAEPLGECTPLTRVGIVSDNETGNKYFCTTACHSTYDAWAYALLWASLEKAYAEGRPTFDQVPYNRFIRYMQKMDLAASDAFWLEQFAGYKPPPLLGNPNGRTVEANAICDLEVHLPRSKIRTNISMPTAIYASWGLALCQLTGASDVTIQLTLSGRNAPVVDIERIMGPILTTVPLRIKVDPLKSARWFLLNLESQCRSMIAHEQCDLQRLRTLSPELQAAVDQSFGLTVNPYNHHKAGVGSGIGLIRPLRIPMAQSPNPFFLDCAITDYGVDAFALIDDRIVDRDLCRTFFAHFESNLRRFTTGNDETLIKDFRLDDKLLAEGAQVIHFAPIGSGLGYDPVTKSTIDVEVAFSKGGILEQGFEVHDARGTRGAIKSEHAQYLKK